MGGSGRAAGLCCSRRCELVLPLLVWMVVAFVPVTAVHAGGGAPELVAPAGSDESADGPGALILELRMGSVDFGQPWGPGELVLRDLEACVASPTGRYRLRAESGYSDGSYLRLGDGKGNTVRYRLIWNDGSTREEIPGDEGLRGPFVTGGADCAGGETNARADIVISEEDWQTARAGQYWDTLRLHAEQE